MLIFTWWMNLMYSGRHLPRQKIRYQYPDGRTERMGPGWLDRPSRLEKSADTLDLKGAVKGTPSHEDYWLREDEWPVCKDDLLLEPLPTPGLFLGLIRSLLH
jgi:hypothetical protein